MILWIEDAWDVICSVLPNANLLIPLSFNKKKSYTNIFFIITSIILLLILLTMIIVCFSGVGIIQNVNIKEMQFSTNIEISKNYNLDRFFREKKQNLP